MWNSISVFIIHSVGLKKSQNRMKQFSLRSRRKKLAIFKALTHATEKCTFNDVQLAMPRYIQSVLDHRWTGRYLNHIHFATCEGGLTPVWQYPNLFMRLLWEERGRSYGQDLVVAKNRNLLQACKQWRLLHGCCSAGGQLFFNKDVQRTALYRYT